MKTAFESSENYKLYFFQKDLEDWAYHLENTFDNAYLTEKSLVFKFSEYEVTAGAAGMPEIEIPLEKAQHLLKDEWKKELAQESARPEEENQPEENNDSKENQNEENIPENSAAHKKSK